MKISDGELKLMELIWDNAPIRSGELVTMAFDNLGWKKSTVYTVVKKLSERSIIKSENAVITPLCTRDEVMSEKSENLIAKGFGGSLPMFLTAFLQKEKLTKAEAEELKKLIDDYTEGD
ncbi:MAG: BlaI/MecI/CopY family transcriptional regulator [Oscillospiraceae bacterium]